MTNRKLLLPAAVLAALAVAAPAASGAQAAPRITDIDADLRSDGRVVLEAETAGATQVHFTYRGRTVKARKGAFDREDRTRDWRRVVRSRSGDAAGGTSVEITVRACKGGRCVTSTEREHLEREDDD